MGDFVKKLAVVTLVAVLGLLMVAVHGAPPAAAARDVETKLRALMDANMAACNEENMDKLLELMSKEMPNRKKFMLVVDQQWSVNDTYNRIDELEVLKTTPAPYGNTKFPYATARIVQTTYYVNQRAEAKAALQGICADGKCDDSEMAHLMAIAPRHEQTEYECLFKFEDGEWKIVANVSAPVPPGSPRRYTHRKRSVF